VTFQITLQGQDITQQTDQMTIDAVDALGQGSGATGTFPLQQGRAGTIQFDTSLGPIVTNLGAGNAGTLSGPPKLVRMGELIVKDAVGNTIWGGYATMFTDISTTKLGNDKQNFTTIQGVDYEAKLNRIIVNQSYVAQTDVQIIKSLMSIYAPYINTSTFLPPSGVFVFPVKNFQNVSVLNALQNIASITGYLIWIDFQKNLHYVQPTNAANAPFYLSDQPDFLSSFPHNVQQFVQDDNSAINRAIFYGGKTPSKDFTQDVSPLANGSNKTFPVAYYPYVPSSGAYVVTVNGSTQTVGYATGTSNAANTFISQGGTAQVLVNPDSHVFLFDTAPGSGATVHITYQYEYPLIVVITDEVSHHLFGDPYLDGTISDSSVFDSVTAIQRCKVLLSQQSLGLVTLKIDCWQGGLKSGQTLKVVNSLRGINGSYLIQEVETQPLGAGNFVYHLTCGSWNWNMIDVLVKVAGGQTVIDNTTQANQNPQILFVNSANNNANAHAAAPVIANTTVAPYYARSAVVGDGHDAFPGFSVAS
jgi:hypothetical protein